ncbi:MAG: hypothetical protein IPJ85_04250 [Flavobacteriales bacterium]|nr:hypothetical protein [Flavobacteriales bacterium]
MNLQERTAPTPGRRCSASWKKTVYNNTPCVTSPPTWTSPTMNSLCSMNVVSAT